MTALHTSRADAALRLNHLQRGTKYQATTAKGSVTGEYLGMEAPYGDRAILIRHATGTESIALCCVTSVNEAA